MRGHHIPYSTEELAWLEANHKLVIGEYHERFCETFCRNDVSRDNLASLRERRGWSTGRTGCFPKGNVPANKGKPMPSRGRSAETQFKKGQLSGRAALVRKPIGTERLSKEGYLERKINGDLPFNRRWRGVHILNWEAVNGPVPEGHALKCLDSNKLNVDPSNWEALPRAVLARLNGGRNKQFVAYDTAAPEVKPTVLALAKLRAAARDRA